MKKSMLLTLLVNVLIIATLLSQEEKQVKILISTEFGDLKAVLYNETPQHRDNFVRLIKDGWYESSPFHRVINNFMIQGGQNADGRLDPGYTVPAEFADGKYHKYGALAAARKGDQVNPTRASSGSQFYIVQGQVLTFETLGNYSKKSGISYTNDQIETYTTTGGTPHLDGAYTVFGEVIEGFEVIDKIATVNTDRANKPLENITMSIKIID
jgi:peptidyl-prolyl cis-trans isomerase B (cyclophilin B)